MTWSKDDWPILNRSEPLSLKTAASGTYMYDQPRKWHDNFKGSKLQLGWYRKNTPLKPESEISLTERPGYLRIHAGPNKLSSPSPPSAIFRKLLHLEGVWKARVAFFPDKARTEAGTVAYWNYFTYCSIGVGCNSEGARQIVFTSSSGDRSIAAVASPKAEIDLVTTIGAHTLQFGFQEVHPNAERVSADSGIHWLGEVKSETLTRSPLVGNPFTGLLLGLYAFSEMKESQIFADFAFAEFL